MSESYGIVLGIDAAQAESGSKATTSAINAVVSSLEKLEQRATSAFAALDRASQRSDFSKLSRDAANQASAAQDMAIAYNALGGAVKRAQTILGQRISGNAAASLATLGREIARFTGQMNQLAQTKGFSNLRSLGSILGGMKFTGPSPAAVRNFQSFLSVVGSANVAQLNAVAHAMQGFSNIRAPRLPVVRPQANASPALANVAGGAAGVSRVRSALEGLNNTLSMSYQLSTVLRVALGSLTLGHFVKDIFDATATMQQFDRMIEAVATSEQEAAQNKTFIDQLTRDIPVSLGVAQSSFGKFNASIRLSGESAANARQLFTDLSTSFAVLHLSTEQMNNAFLAVEEMFNKGTVTSQQLKRQLSQYLPGAFELVAASVGKTTAQLAALMEQGQVPAKVMFKLGETLRSIYGPELAAAVVTSRNQLTLLSNDVQKFLQQIGKSGFDSGLSSMLQGIRQAMGASDLEDAAKRIGEGFQTAFTYIGAAASVIIENWDTVSKVLLGFTGFTVLSIGITALGALISPFMGLMGLLGEEFLLTAGAAGVAAAGIGSVGTAAGVAAPALATAATAGGAAGLAAAGAGTAAAGSVGLWARATGAVGRFGSATTRLAGGLLKGLGLAGLAVELPNIGYWAEQGTAGLDDMLGATQALHDNFPDFSKFLVDHMPKGGKLLNFQDGWAGLLGLSGNDGTEKATEETKKIADAAKAGLAPSGDVPPLIKFLGLDKAYAAYQQSMSKIQSAQADYAAKMSKVDNAIFEANKKRQEELDKLRAQSLDTMNKKTQQLLQKIDPISKARTDAAQEQKILDDLLQKKLINEDQYQAYKKRLDYENLRATNPYSATVRDFEEQFAVLKKTGDERDTENKLLQLRNKLLKEGVDIEKDPALQDNLRALIDAQRELERGGSNGMARWSAGLKSFREELIDVEKNGVEKLSDGLADLSVGKGMDISKIGMGVLRDFNKSIINDLMRKAIDPIKGMNSPLASIFGLGAPDPKKALAGANAIKDTVKPITSQGLMDQINAGSLNVTAGTVNINGGVASTPGVQSNTGPNGQVIKPGGTFDKNFSPQAASNDFRVAGNNNILPSGQFAGSVVDPKKVSDSALAGGTGILSPANGASNALVLSPALGIGAAAAAASKPAGTIAGYANGFKETPNVSAPVTVPTSGGASGLTLAGDLSSRATFQGKQMDPNAVQGIIFHHTGGGGTPEGVVDTLNKRGLGTQYVMGRDGKVFQTLPENMSGAQIMPSDRFASKGAPPGLSNSNTVGIEMIARDNKDLTDAQIASAKRFYAEEKLKYPNAQPFGHGEVNPGHKEADEGMGAVNAIRNPATDPGITGSITKQVQDETAQLQAATSQASSSLSNVATDFTQVASSAQGATGGLGSIIPMLSKLAGGAGGGAGGAGGLFGMFKEGGYSTSPVSAYAASSAAFRNAPHFAEGTSHAVRAAGTPSVGGGFPAVLHDNEAVIPLTRGREVPVALTGDGVNSNPGGSQNTTNVHLHGVKDFDSFRRSKSQMKADMAAASHVASQRNN